MAAFSVSDSYFSVGDFNVDKNDNGFIVSADGSMKTIFLPLGHITKIDANIVSEVVHASNQVELALVLDNTGSMNCGAVMDRFMSCVNNWEEPGDDSRIAGLKTAANTLVSSLMTGEAAEEFIKIAVVPFEGTVNIKNASLDYSWLDWGDTPRAKYNGVNFDQLTTQEENCTSERMDGLPNFAGLGGMPSLGALPGFGTLAKWADLSLLGGVGHFGLLGGVGDHDGGELMARRHGGGGHGGRQAAAVAVAAVAGKTAPQPPPRSRSATNGCSISCTRPIPTSNGPAAWRCARSRMTSSTRRPSRAIPTRCSCRSSGRTSPTATTTIATTTINDYLDDDTEQRRRQTRSAMSRNTCHPTSAGRGRRIRSFPYENGPN